MKNVVWIYLIVLIFSCKQKGDEIMHPSDSSNSTALTSDETTQHGHDPKHYHYYKIYRGKFEPSKNETGSIRTCKFNNKEYKYYKNDIGSEGSIENIWVYILEDEINSTIISVNPEIDRYHNPRMKEPFGTQTKLGKGNYGCIPKFIADLKGDLLVFNDGTQKYLNLNIAKHNEMNSTDSTVYLLRNHKFLIADSDYDSLNIEFRKSNFIQGGISEPNITEMIIYDSNDTPLITVNNLNNN